MPEYATLSTTARSACCCWSWSLRRSTGRSAPVKSRRVRRTSPAPTACDTTGRAVSPAANPVVRRAAGHTRCKRSAARSSSSGLPVDRTGTRPLMLAGWLSQLCAKPGRGRGRTLIGDRVTGERVTPISGGLLATGWCGGGVTTTGAPAVGSLGTLAAGFARRRCVCRAGRNRRDHRRGGCSRRRRRRGGCRDLDASRRAVRMPRHQQGRRHQDGDNADRDRADRHDRCRRPVPARRRCWMRSDVEFLELEVLVRIAEVLPLIVEVPRRFGHRHEWILRASRSLGVRESRMARRGGSQPGGSGGGCGRRLGGRRRSPRGWSSWSPRLWSPRWSFPRWWWSWSLLWLLWWWSLWGSSLCVGNVVVGVKGVGTTV